MLWLFSILIACEESNPSSTPTLSSKEENIEKKISTPKKPQLQKETVTPKDNHFHVKNISSLSLAIPNKERKVPQAVSLSPVHEATRNALKGMVEQHGLLIDNPWALLHALLALGPNAKLPDGTPAIDRLFTEHAEPSFDDTLIQFPKKKESHGKTILIEPHTDLALKVLTEIGVDPEQIYTVKGKKHSFANLFRSSLLETHLDPRKNLSSFQSPNDTPWNIQGLSTFLSPGTTWESNGMVMRLEDLTTFLMAVVYQETRFMAAAYQQQKTFDKKKQGNNLVWTWLFLPE